MEKPDGNAPKALDNEMDPALVKRIEESPQDFDCLMVVDALNRMVKSFDMVKALKGQKRSLRFKV